MSDLRQKVAKALCCNDGKSVCCDEFCVAEQFLTEADIAIALVLEEAAKVAEDYDGPGIIGGYDRHLGDAFETRRDIVAAIRALKYKP